MLKKFRLESAYKPAGDQPQAIEGLVSSLKKGNKKQTLLGVTGSGKTFTVANVIQELQKPTLVIAHNKTLAAQLCNEFREFFPHNAVEYFVSYYDYYQPEAYIASSDTYIEKEAQINDEIDRLRHACTQALLSRKDVIIVASVSAIYNLGSPKEYEQVVLHLKKGDKLDRRGLMQHLIDIHFERTNSDLSRGQFRMRGQMFEIMPVNEERVYRFEVSSQIDVIERIHPVTRTVEAQLQDAWFFPAKHYIAGEQVRLKAMENIKNELKERLAYFKKKGMPLEYERLKRRVKYDLEMIANVGYCNGIENYSRHFDGRLPGEAAFSLLDFFRYGSSKGLEDNADQERNFLVVIDESHVTLPQIRGMYHGDRARKENLINHGFRLPSAFDNRPLTYDEFDERVEQVIYVSATPSEYEYQESAIVAEQVVRPTGLVDPEVSIRPVTGDGAGNNLSQVEDVILEIQSQVKKKERTLVTTLTKKMAEDLTEHLEEKKIQVKYLHSDIKTIERIEIITELRRGNIDVIVGVNLLREGLDIPEVSLVAILDADKEGFLRSKTSLIQTIGRAARNINGRVILYADHQTGSIKQAIEETKRRRDKQLAYNKKHNITPKTIEKAIKNILEEFGITGGDGSGKGHSSRTKNSRGSRKILDLDLLGDGRDLSEIIKDKETKMREAAQKLEFELAAILRDEIRELTARQKMVQSPRKKKR